MKQVAQKLKWAGDHVAVQWFVTARCNFNCSYCSDWDDGNTTFEYYHDNKSKHPPFDKLKTAVDKLIDGVGNNIEWGFVGGEPMVMPAFHDIVKYIRSTNPHDIAVATNGTLPLKRMSEIYQVLDGIIISLHFEHIEKRVEEYIEKIIALEEQRENHQMLTARFMVYPGKLDLVRKMYEEFALAGVDRIEFRSIQPHPGINWHYSPEEHTQMNEWYDNYEKRKPNIIRHWEDGSHTEDMFTQIVHNQEHRYKDWTCWAGVEQLRIDPHGRVTRCAPAVDGILGNIYEDKIIFPTGPVKCTQYDCKDYCDLRVTKYLEGYHDLVS